MGLRLGGYAGFANGAESGSSGRVEVGFVTQGCSWIMLEYACCFERVPKALTGLMWSIEECDWGRDHEWRQEGLALHRTQP